MISLRRAAVVLASTGLLACFGKAAPPTAPTKEPPDAAAEERFHLDVDAHLTAKLDAARDAIKAEEWDKAAAVLQELLDLNEERMAEVGGDKHPRLVGVRAEAGRMLAGLPAAGKKAYQASVGPRAADLLKEGIKDKDETKIAEVVSRFLNTDAGPDALEALAGLHYDAGRYHLAALCYERLFGLRDAAKWAPETLFRAADAWRRVGDKERAGLAGKRLLERLGGDGLRIGDRKLDRDDVEKELGKPVEAKGDWPMFGGDAGRSARRDGGMPFLRYDWEVSTVVPFGENPRPGSTTFKERVETLFKTASDRLTQGNQPVLPSQFPITAAVTFKSDGKMHSLVVFRTHSGIAACDMAGGKLRGRAPIRGTLEWMMSDGRENFLSQWTQAYIGGAGQPAQRPGILFENTTIGTLSTDGEYAFTVEDLAVPPPPVFRIKIGFPGGANPYGWPQDILDAVNHNRLMAYDLTAGCKTVWETPDDKDKTDELTDSYFLGPPLPLDGRLFVLNEKQEGLRLVCLETVKEGKGVEKPRISFVLPLGKAPSGLGDDALRRVCADLLSYGDGIIVCPTNLGCVVGVDVLTRDVAWVHRYEAPKAAAAPAPAGGRFLWRGAVPPAAPPQSEWRSPAPVVSGGAVVVAPPDDDSLSCLDLKTGEMKWKEPRREGDLYLAGVFDGRVLVVGKRTCRAHNLSDGKLLWTVDAGLPSGQGAAAGGVYYLPLREAAATKQPEVCGIDLAKGKIFAHAPLNAPAVDRKTDALGNLLFSDGVMVSQTTTEVVAYPLLKAKLEQMDAALAKNPDDPEGLYSRAELRFEQGESVAAVDDLRKVIDGKPSAELLARARGKLYEVLTQLLQNGFTKGEKYLKEYEELSKAGANDAETRRRRAVYYLLTGQGYAAQGRPLEALKAYEELGAFGDDPLPSPDDAALRVSPDVWAKSHIAELLQKATPDQRKQLQEEIDRRLKGAKDSDGVEELRAFTALFDSSTAAGRGARLELAERLIDKAEHGREAEVLLTDVAQHSDDPETAGRAVEALARLSTRLGLLEDALYYYRILNRDYEAIKVRDGRTGADFFKEVAADKRFLPFLGDKPAPFEKDRLRAKGEVGAFPYADLTFLFTHEGESLPFFRCYRLGLEFDKHELALLDRASGEPRGKPIPVTETLFQNLVAYPPDGPDRRLPILFPGAAPPKPTATPVFPYRTVGRLVVVPVGPMVFAVDAVEGKLLWKKNVSERMNQPSWGAPLSTDADPRDGDLLASYSDGWLQRVGPGAEVLTPSALCLMTRDGLTAIDPPTGRMLWQRNDVADGARLFGDDAHLCVVETKNGRMEQTRVFRTADGSDLSAPDFRAVYEKRQQVVGCDFLAADSDKAGLTLRLYDPLTGKDLWKETYPAGSLPLTSLAPHLTGAVEPGGKLHVVDLRSLKEVFAGAVDPRYFYKVESVYLLDDGKRFYVACNAALADNVRVTSDLTPGTGLRDLPVNGEVYAFDAAGGKNWHIACPNQRLLLDGFAEAPAVVFAARQLKFQAPFGGVMEPSIAVCVVEKRTGKLLIDQDNSGGGPIHTISVDPAKGRVEITAPKERITITAEEK